MKKLMIGLVGALAMVASAEVESNEVGYTIIPAEKGVFKMIGVQFQKEGTENKKIPLEKLITMKNIPTVCFDEMETSGIELQIREGNGYRKYYYINDAYNADGDEVTGWSNADGDLVTEADSQKIGDGFWMIARTLTDESKEAGITLQGGVLSDATEEISFGTGFTIVANPFPLPVSLNTLGLKGITASTFDEMETTGIELQVREGNGYRKYYYISDAYNEDGDEVTGWCDANGDLSLGNEIPVGASFWVKAPANGSFTFSR